MPHPEPAAAGSSRRAGGRQPTAVAAPSSRCGPYGEIIAAMAEAHGVDPILVRALIQVESNNKPTGPVEQGGDGADAADALDRPGIQGPQPLRSEGQIEAGVKKLKWLLDRFGTVDLALAAYNAGEGAVKKFNGIPPYRETQNYVSRILSLAGLR